MALASALTHTTLRADVNALRLPVRLPEHAPGSTEAIHPTDVIVSPAFTAANAVLSALQRAPIDPGAVLTAGITYCQMSDERRPQHALLTRDLATRGEPIAEFDLATIADPALRSAISELIFAAALGDVYARVQVEPQYLEQLRTVIATGDAVRIHHYWLRGRIGAMAPVAGEEALACNPVPGGERTRNGIWWPADWTSEDIEHLKTSYQWSSELLQRQVFSPHSRIREISIDESMQEDRLCFGYKGHLYSVEPLNSDPTLRTIAQLMAKRIERAADLLAQSAAEYAGMLRSMADDLRSTALFADFAHDQRWATVGHPNLSVVIGRTEHNAVYGDPFGIKAPMRTMIGYKDASNRAMFDQLRVLAPQAHARLVALWTAAGTWTPPPFSVEAPPVPAVESVSILFAGGSGNAADKVPAGFNIPNPGQYFEAIPERDMRKRLLLFQQILELRLRNQGLPLARALFDSTVVQKLEAAINNVHAQHLMTLAHELAHSSGVKLDLEPDVVAAYGHDGANHTTSVASAMEEEKADMIGQFHLAWYAALGVVTEADQQDALSLFLGNLLHNLLIGPTNIHSLGAVYQWNLLLEYGIVSYADGAYHFDEDLFWSTVPQMTKDFSDLMGSRDAARVRAWSRQAMEEMDPNTEIAKAIARVREAGGPVLQHPYYVVKGLPEFS